MAPRRCICNIAKVISNLHQWYTSWAFLVKLPSSKSHKTSPYWCLANIGSDNGLVPPGNKPLPEPMLTIFISPYGVIRPQKVNFISYVSNWAITISNNGLAPFDSKTLYEPMMKKKAIESVMSSGRTWSFCSDFLALTHWGRVTHICVSKVTTIGSDNGLSPGQCQANIWTNAGILLIRTLGRSFSEMLSKIHEFSFKKTHLKMLSGRWRPFYSGPQC